MGICTETTSPSAMLDAMRTGEDAAPPPVFLHGMWRSGSTFLWSRFRAAAGTCCFYEPLHHGLARLTHERIRREAPDLTAANHHPALASPYFSEFAPLIDRRGVRNYRKRFAAERFSLTSDEADEPLRRYIHTLVGHAAAQGRRAVLGFNRSGLRIGWLKVNAPAYNIHLDRDPLAVWRSYEAERARGNYAFFEMWLRVVEANARDPLWTPVIDRLHLNSLAGRFSLDPKRRRHALIDRMNIEDTYFLVFYAWLALMRHALAECELIVDVQLSADPAYARKVEAKIREAVGVAVDLTDLKPAPERDASPTPWMRAGAERDALALFPAPERRASPERWREKLGAISPRKADLIAAVI